MTSGAPPGQDYFQCYGTKNGQYCETTEFWMLGQRINNWWLIFQSNAWLPGWEIYHDCEVGAGRCIQHWNLDAFKYRNAEFDTRSNPRCQIEAILDVRYELIGIIQWEKPPKCWEIRALEALRRASGIVFYNRTRLMLLKLWIRMIARWSSCWILLSTELSKRHDGIHFEKDLTSYKMFTCWYWWSRNLCVRVRFCHLGSTACWKFTRFLFIPS